MDNIYTLLFPVSLVSTLYISALTIKTYYECRTTKRVHDTLSRLEIPLRQSVNALTDLNDSKTSIYSNLLSLCLNKEFMATVIQLLTDPPHTPPPPPGDSDYSDSDSDPCS
jgi:hypothetical protein